MAHAETCAEKEVPQKTPATEVPSPRDILEGLRKDIQNQGMPTHQQHHIIAIFGEQSPELLNPEGGIDTIKIAKDLYAILANDPKIKMKQARSRVRTKIGDQVATIEAVEIAQSNFDTAVSRYYGLEELHPQSYPTSGILTREDMQSESVEQVEVSVPTPVTTEYPTQKGSSPISAVLPPLSKVGQTLWQEKSREWQELMVIHVKDISELGPVGRKMRIDNLKRLSMVRSLLRRGFLYS